VRVLGINEQVPSPTIEVMRGDRLVVHVQNNDPVHSHSLHWHGLAMRGAPEYDGVAGVTQCGILPLESMTYSFVVLDEPGTYWYHGHAGLPHAGARGIAGPLIIRPRPQDEVHEGTYSRDELLFVGDWAHEPPAAHYAKSLAGFHESLAQSAQWHNVALYKWTSALVNGYGGHYGGVYSVVNVVKGETTRLRICNVRSSQHPHSSSIGPLVLRVAIHPCALASCPSCPACLPSAVHAQHMGHAQLARLLARRGVTDW
jgi:FtsP/CotA-like multicopper oxidase with cupredoxin domain